jgi:hypothetical protein
MATLRSSRSGVARAEARFWMRPDPGGRYVVDQLLLLRHMGPAGAVSDSPASVSLRLSSLRFPSCTSPSCRTHILGGVSAGDVLQLVSTAFAAVAAIGSAVAAWVMYRQWLGGRTPSLSVDVAEVHPKRTLYMTVVNHGGPVKKVCFAAVEGDQACVSFLPPHGFLGPGERARVELCMDSIEVSTIAVVYGFDLDGKNVYAWSANGNAGRCRRGRRDGDDAQRT